MVPSSVLQKVHCGKILQGEKTSDKPTRTVDATITYTVQTISTTYKKTGIKFTMGKLGLVNVNVVMYRIVSMNSHCS